MKKIILSLLSVILISTACIIPAHAESVRSISGTSLLPFVILTDPGYTVPFPIGVSQNVNVSLTSYSSYKKVTKINSFSYFDHSSIDYGVTGTMEIHNSDITMSGINETPLIYDGNSLVSPTWTWDNDYVIPGSGSTYGFSNTVPVTASGFVWMPNAVEPYWGFSVSGSVT